MYPPDYLDDRVRLEAAVDDLKYELRKAAAPLFRIIDRVLDWLAKVLHRLA